MYVLEGAAESAMRKDVVLSTIRRLLLFERSRKTHSSLSLGFDAAGFCFVRKGKGEQK